MLCLVLQPQLADVGFAMMADAVRGATMVQTTRAWARELERLHARISHHFRRAEPRRRSLAYLKALAASVERKNGWQMAEAVGDSTPDGMQRLLNQAEWDTDHVLAQVVAYQICVPLRLVEQSLHTIWGTVSNSLGHLPAVLTLHRSGECLQVS